MNLTLNRTPWYLFCLTPLFTTSLDAHAAAWWYEQAERLQNVSATLLDGPPLSEPVPTTPFLAARVATSLLPKPSSKVGDKEEKVPSAPLHAVPTLVAGRPFISSKRYGLVGTAWAGYLPLPVSIAKIMGINASLKQYTLGVSLENMFRLNQMILTTSAGYQYGNANLSGAITSSDAHDTFDTSTSLIHFSQGIQGRTIPLWANLMFLLRRGKSKFNISLEQTEFVRTDTMSDAQIPLATQVTVGSSFGKSLQIAVSEYIVPDRLIMPRVSFVYQYRFSDAGQSSANANNTSFDGNTLDTSAKSRTSSTRKKRRPAPSLSNEEAGGSQSKTSTKKP